jgi:hypothetical protein
MKIDEEVIDADVVDDADTDNGVTTAAEAQEAGANENVVGLLNLEELIKNHIDSMDKLKEELKQVREMFEDSFNNNPTYNEHLEKVKEASKGKNSVRQEIAKQPSVATLEQKVKDIRFDINEKSKTLSDLLQDYKDQTGNTEIETRSGQILEIVSTAKLIKRASSK